MAFKFALVKPNDSRRVGYYGFAWSTLLMGPLTPLMRRDFGDSFMLMLGEILICMVVVLFDNDWLLLAARLGVITFMWALFYNELYTLGLMSSGFRLDGSHEVVSALEGRFPAEGRADRIRLLRERCLLLVVLGLGCLQLIFPGPNSRGGFFHLAHQSPSAKLASTASDAPRVALPPPPTAASPPSPPAVPSAAETARPVATPTPTSFPATTPGPAVVPRMAETPRPAPIPASPTPIPSATAVPRAAETPRPPEKAAATVLAEQQQACDGAMASQFDSDLPKNAKYVFDVSGLAEDDVDRAIASCEIAQIGPGRRFKTELGRAYAAKAMLLAAQDGKDAEAKEFMKKATDQWSIGRTQGSGAAMNFLGALYNGTFNSPTFSFLESANPNYPKALDFYLEGDKAGNAKAARNAGAMLLLGSDEYHGVARNIIAAKALLLRAIHGDNMAAASLYGQALFYGYPEEIGKNHGAEGIEYLKKACGAGDPTATVFFDKEYARSKRSPLLPPTRPPGC